MKKYLFILILTLAFITPSYAEDINGYDFAVTPADLEDGHFFRSPVGALVDPEVRTTTPVDYSSVDDSADSHGISSMRPLKEGEMPFFKQVRVYLTNKTRKIMHYDAPEPNPYAETETDENGEVKVSKSSKKPFGEKLKFWKKKKAQTPNSSNITAEEGSIVESIQSEISEKSNTEETLSLESGISTHVTQKELTLDADNVNFDEETGDMVATGRPLLYVPPQKATVIADKMIYNQDSNTMKGIGNVVVIKDGMPTTADYAEVNMNEETMMMDNMKTHSDIAIIDAEKGVQQNDTLIFTNGNIHSDESRIFRMESRMIGPNFSGMIVNDEDKGLFFGDPTGNKITFDADEIIIDAGKNHDKITAKHVKFKRKGKHWFTWPSITAYTDKERNYFEANYPEFGSKHKLGMFVGPGFTFGGPAGSIIKVIPFLNYQKKFGFGGALKYHNKFNYTELGYGSSDQIFFLRGEQRLDDDLYLRYGSNSYMDEWFLGSRMPKYIAELVYDKSYYKPSFLAEGRGLSFSHRLGAGIMQDNDRNYYSEKFNGGITTARFRYMASMTQNLYHYEKPENTFYFDFSFMMQGSAAVYGTGATQFIGRMGPLAHVQYKNWMQDIAYYQTAYQDESPMPRYDAYRYGHSSLRIAEVLRLHKYLSIGWSGMVNLSNDSPNGKLFQENRFVVALGPDDLKVRIGYDFVRQTTSFGFDVAFDTKGTTVNYKRMEIKNPERFGKEDKNTRKLAFSPASLEQPKEQKPIFSFGAPKVKERKVLQHAQVINIEDPDKETVD